MRISISIPVLNQQSSTQETLNSLKATQSQDLQYIIVDNGSTPPVREWLIGLSGDDQVIRNKENVGLPKALNQAMAITDADYVFHTHSDITMFEQDWDLKVIKAIEEAGNVGVAGFYGAYGIGAADIYRTPYDFRQMARIMPMAGIRCRQDPKVHGHSQFNEEWRKCAVLDGFSLIVKSNSGFVFDESFGPMHNYDNDVCLQAYDMGMQVICINMDVQHHGGRTEVGEDWAVKFGKTKDQVHKESHVPIYEKWRPGKRNISLPFRA